ncbi:MAG: hypothetical protein QME75_01185 [Deltaproteobacteria bacterium]|nr:hypothetical protein [Deltaproteobacteria bacterium]
MKVEPLWLMIFFGVAGLALLIINGIRTKRQQRLRNLILRRLS